MKIGENEYEQFLADVVQKTLTIVETLEDRYREIAFPIILQAFVDTTNSKNPLRASNQQLHNLASLLEASNDESFRNSKINTHSAHQEIPLIEEIDGDYIVSRPGLSARLQLELILYKHYPERCSLKDLIRWVHNHSEENVRVTLRTMKVKNTVHLTDAGYKLTEIGLHEVETEIEKLKDATGQIKEPSLERIRGSKHGKK